jgi:ankyrin repeat protein
MYLSMRTNNVSEEDDDGMTAFLIYLERADIERCKQLLMRGAHINYENKFGVIPIHFAIDKRLPEKVVKFLLKHGAK